MATIKDYDKQIEEAKAKREKLIDELAIELAKPLLAEYDIQYKKDARKVAKLIKEKVTADDVAELLSKGKLPKLDDVDKANKKTESEEAPAEPETKATSDNGEKRRQKFTPEKLADMKRHAEAKRNKSNAD